MTAAEPSTSPIRASFQGEPGAFSHDAANRFFGAGVVTIPCRTFEEMFEAVEQGRADCAIVPIENTLAGSVIKNYDLLVEHDFTIVAELVLRIVHNLIAAPGVKLEELRRVYSHPVALPQCERFLKAHKQLEVTEHYDTAGSVKMIMERGRRDEAAIAGAAAAQVYGAAIVVPGIESNKQNYTRFFVLVPPARAAAIPVRAPADAPRRTSIVFRIANQPGGLYAALAAFATENVDLTKIESRPIEGRPWEYSFYVDFVGAVGEPGPDRALAKLSAGADSVRVLGSYPRIEL
jgi:prephenate dehydratase